MMCGDADLARTLARDSDRICALILYSDVPWIDVEIEINKLRNRVLDEAPAKMALFNHLYVSRFERLRSQWRMQERSF